MSSVRIALPILAFLIGVGAVPPATAACQLESVELPVYMSGPRPHVKAAINGTEVSFLLDSGAIYSVIDTASAEKLALRTQRAPGNLQIYGVGGRADVRVTRVEHFRLGKTTFDNVEFLVLGATVSPTAIGLLGQNFLGASDVEYDLANGLIRIHDPSEECKTARLAYWAKPEVVAEAELKGFEGSFLQHIVSVAFVNDRKLRVVLDTGAAASMMTLPAARGAGLQPDGEGVVAGGPVGGIGKNVGRSWIGPVKSFALGGERIRDTRLRFADMFSPDADMLLGADFFLSHRVYVARSQNKIYFTYNGGPVFDLSLSTSSAEALGPDASATSIASDAPPLSSADAYARRGAAFAARHDYRHALADLARASAMEPEVASHFIQRAQVNLALRQLSAAVADLDEAVRLAPSDLDVRMARAQLHLVRRDDAAAREDMVAISSAAPPESSFRQDLARLFFQIHRPEDALLELDQWIATHARAAELHAALNERCWARALMGKELDKALADCDAAIKARPGTAAYLDSRGLVQVRLGNYDQAIQDYDAALRVEPKIAWSLYGRGIARLRKGDTDAGNADIAAAKKAVASIEDDARRYGLTQ